MKRDDFRSYFIYIQHNTFAYTNWREALPGPGSGSGWAGACEWQVCDLLLFQSQLQVCQATGVHKMSQICILSWHLLSFIWTAAPVSLKPGRTETDLTQLSLRSQITILWVINRRFQAGSQRSDIAGMERRIFIFYRHLWQTDQNVAWQEYWAKQDM